MSLLKSRDSKAFSYLYDNYSASLYTIIAQMVNDMEVANDVLQEVFINIWRKIESYDPVKGRLFTWMLNIARNASIDTLRSRGFQNTRKNQSLQDKKDWPLAAKPDWVNIDNIGLKELWND